MGEIINLEDKKNTNEKKFDLVNALNGKRVYSIYNNTLVTFVERITEAMYMEEDGVYSDGINMVDNIEEIEKDCSGMYCRMKDGSACNMEDFYAEFGAFDKNSNFPENVMNLIEDRSEEEKAYKAPEIFSILVKESYKSVDELASFFYEHKLAPSDVEYLVTAKKVDGAENEYLFAIYCGFGCFYDRYKQFSGTATVLGGDDAIEKYMHDMLDRHIGSICWKDALKDYKSANEKEALGNWLYKGDNKERIECIKDDVQEIGIDVHYENGEVVIEFLLKTHDDVHVFKGENLKNTYNSSEQRECIWLNHDIYHDMIYYILGYGYMHWNKVVSIDTYKEMVKRELEVMKKEVNQEI